MCLSRIDVAILCGGKGTRIAHLLGDTPKVLAPINGRPYLDYLVAKLKRLNARSIVLCTGHLPEKIIRWSKGRDDVMLSPEFEPSGTAGAVKNAASFLLSDPVLIINGDTLSTIDLCVFTEAYYGTPLTAIAYIYESGGELEYAGHYLLSRDALRDLEKGVFTDLAVFFRHLQLSRHAAAYQMGGDCYLDIGSPEDYRKAARFVKEFHIDYQ